VSGPVILYCRDCKHSFVPGAGMRQRCRRAVAMSDGMRSGCADARTSREWWACGPRAELFEHRLPWWRRALGLLNDRASRARKAAAKPTKRGTP